MDLRDADVMARELMERHGLTGWSLAWDSARTRAGVCRPSRRQIGLSRVLTALHDADRVRDTVLHEIAHALVGVEPATGCSGGRWRAGWAAALSGAWTPTPRVHRGRGWVAAPQGTR